MSEKILTAHNLKYEWRTNDIFSNEPNRILWQIPSLEINAPGMILLVGRNGVGKSTLLRCLLGLMRPSRGEIKWFDEEKTPRGKIGYIPELPVLPARIKVAELLESLLGLNAEKIDQMEAINSRTHSLSILNLLNRPAHLLSKGQQQRLLLTLALSGQPKGFVLDEPFSGLDPWARTELADLLISLAEQKKFLLISSHDAPQRLRVHVRETWVIENEQLKIQTGCALPE